LRERQELHYSGNDQNADMTLKIEVEGVILRVLKGGGGCPYFNERIDGVIVILPTWSS